MANDDGHDEISALLGALSNPLTRRRFLQWLGVSTATACAGGESSAPQNDAGSDASTDTSDAGETNDTSTGEPVDWFGAMERLRDAFRGSPDHLASRAAALVSAADPAAILSFVRDEIRLVPTDHDAVTRFDLDWMHWGPTGALRSGRGTHRTRAELLATLYRDAGFDAAVYIGTVSLSQDELRALMLASPSASAPALTEAEAQAMAAALTGTRSGGAALTTTFPSSAAADALAASILATIPAPGSTADWLGNGFDGDLALVGVTVDGELRFANPNHPSAAFGDSGTGNTPNLAAPARSAEVEVRLEWALASAPDDPVVLVEHTWPATDVVGRRLSAVLQPFGDYTRFATADAEAQREFVPMLVFDKQEGDAGSSGDPAQNEGPDPVRGDVVTLSGATIAIDTDAETITIDGFPIATGQGSAAAAQVAELSADASGTTFPDVRVRVRALDADGNAVAGLDANALEVQDDGTRVPFLLTANSPSRPRVLFIVDNSGSVDAAFLGANLSPRLRTIMESVAAAHPDAEFAIEHINFGISATPDWTTDIDALIAAHEETFADGSEIWSAAATAQATGATAAVLITDGEAGDASTAALEAAIAGDVPIVCVHASTTGENLTPLETIATLSGGVVVGIDAPDTVASQVVDALATPFDAFYSLTWASPATAAGERPVEVRVTGGPVGTTSYQVPESLRGITPNAPIGLYYVVRIDDRTVRRTLAGWTPVGFQAPDPDLIDDYARDVRTNAMSGVTLHFEAGAPTNAVLMDDLLTSRLSMRGFVPFLAAEETALTLEPAFLDAITPPVPGAVDVLFGTPDRIDQTPIFPLGLCVVAAGTHARRLDSDRAQRTGWVDLLPLTRYGAYGDSASSSFEHAARATAMQALWEAGTFADSTVSALDGRTLVSLPAFSSFDDLGVTLTDEQRATLEVMLRDARESIIVLDAGGDPVGAWVVEPATGAIIGRLPSGRGGAQTVAELNYLKNVLGWASWLGGATGAMNATHGALAALVIFHIKMWTIADAVVGSLTPVSDEQVDKEIAGLLCDIVRSFGASALGPGAGGVDALWGLVENIIGTSLCEAITGSGQLPK